MPDAVGATRAKPKPQGLKFVESSHRYYLDGKPIPGVTGLLSKGLPKDALMYWSAKTVAEFVADNPEQVEALRAMGRGPMIGALKGVPWQKRDDAGARGTQVHALAERVIHGDEVEVPAHLADHVNGYVRWLDAFNVEPIMTEFPVYHRSLWYAGTCDAVVRMGGETLGLDLKTSGKVYGQTALQIAAYVKADTAVIDGVEQPIPPVDRIAVAHVTDHGTRHRFFRDLDSAWDQFQAVAAVAKRRAAIDEQLMDETPYPEEDES